MASRRDLKKDPSTPYSEARGNVHQRFRGNDGDVVNEADEAFLHDHKKCLEAQALKYRFNLDLVLPGQDSEYTAGRPQSKDEKTFFDSFDLELVPTSEVSSQWKSPPCSPLSLNSLPSTPVACNSKDVEFVLKQENDLR